MDGPDIAAMWDTQHKEFSKLPQGISVKMLMSLTVVAAMLREPSPGLWHEFMDRAEGKVKDQQEHSGEVIITINYSDVTAPSSSATDDQSTGEAI